MTILRYVSALALFAALGLAEPARAQFSRVFIAARTGNDANACNDVAVPCRTLQRGVDQAASDGEVIVLESGGYGPASITRGVTVEAPDGIVGFVHPPSGDAITINAPSSQVVLRGLTLNGAGVVSDGIVVTAGSLTVDRCTITRFGLIAGSVGGIVMTSGGSLLVTDSTFRGNYDGIHLNSSSGNPQLQVRRCRFENNGNRAMAVYPSVPLNGTVTDTFLTGSIVGIEIGPPSGTPSITMTIDHSTFTGNSDGVFRAGTAATVVRASNSIFTGNTRGFVGALTRGDNTIQDNASCNVCLGSGTYASN